MFGSQGRSRRRWATILEDCAVGRGTSQDPNDCPERIRMDLARESSLPVHLVLAKLPSSSLPVLELLAQSPYIQVQVEVAGVVNLDGGLLDKLSYSPVEQVALTVASNRGLLPSTALRLARHESPAVRKVLLDNRQVPDEVLLILKDDEDPGVVMKVVGHHGASVDLLREIGSRRFTQQQAGSRYAISKLHEVMSRRYGWADAYYLTRALVRTPLHEPTAVVLERSLGQLDQLTAKERMTLEALFGSLEKSFSLEELIAMSKDTLHTLPPSARSHKKGLDRGL